MELLISIIIGAALIEIYAWLPSLSQWLVEKAVSGVPTQEQERCRDEWKATLETLLNSAIKIVHALSLVLSGAPRIRFDFREQTAEALNTTISEFTNIERDLERIGKPLEAMVAELASTEFERELAVSSGRLLGAIAKMNDTVARKKLPPATNEQLMEALSHFRTVTEVRNERLSDALNAERKRLLENAGHMLDSVQAMAAVVDKHLPILDALRLSKLPFREWEAALDKACDDFQAELDVCTCSFDAGSAGDLETPNNDALECDCDGTEFNDAFAALRTIIASLRRQGASGPNASGADGQQT
jgi:hypothetical protein